MAAEMNISGIETRANTLVAIIDTDGDTPTDGELVVGDDADD